MECKWHRDRREYSFSHLELQKAKIKEDPRIGTSSNRFNGWSDRMNPIRTCVLLSALLIACSLGSFAQDQSQDLNAVKPLPPITQEKPVASPTDTSGSKAPDKAAAYYHFAMAHIYEEMVSMYGRADYANKAIEEYRLAIDNDPTSDYLNAGLAELYARTGRIKDAVLEAQDILKRDGNNLDAHRLLGRIYLRSLGDMQ